MLNNMTTTKHMEIVAPYMVGEFKYIIGHNAKGEKVPIEIYLTEAQITVKPVTDEEEGECLLVLTKYTARGNGVTYTNIDSKDIYATRKDVLRKLGYETRR